MKVDPVTVSVPPAPSMPLEIAPPSLAALPVKVESATVTVPLAPLAIAPPTELSVKVDPVTFSVPPPPLAALAIAPP